MDIVFEDIIYEDISFTLVSMDQNYLKYLGVCTCIPKQIADLIFFKPEDHIFNRILQTSDSC